MWIPLGIVSFLLLVAAGALLLPVYVIVKTDPQEGLYIRLRVLGKTYGDQTDTDSPVLKSLKEALGISRLEKEDKAAEEKVDPIEKLKGKIAVVTGLLKELKRLLQESRVKVFRVKIVCADPNPATAAVHYGLCYAVAAPALAYLQSILRIEPKGREVDIACDYEAEKDSFYFETVLAFRVYRILLALLRITKAEKERQENRP